MSTAAKRVCVEVTVDSVDGALAAADGGADRIELCGCLEVGGLTPSPALVVAVRAAVAMPIFAMARPRPGDFAYTTREFAVLMADIAALRKEGIDGIVAGTLRHDGQVDRERLAMLLAETRPLPLTFHRAFDVAKDPHTAFATLLELGVDRLLSSGQAPTAPQGAALLAELVRVAAGRLQVMAGCGVRAANVAALVAATGVPEVHLSASVWRDGPMTFRRPQVPMGTSPHGDYAVRTTDRDEIARVVAALPAPAPR